MQEFDHIPIEILNLPRRIYHALARGGILTVGNLRDFCQNKNRYHVRNFGEKSFNEISKVLEELPNNPLVLAYRKKDLVQLSFHNTKWREGTSQTPIDVLNLPPAIRGMLKIKGIKTIDDLRNASDTELLKINLIGPKKLMEIKHLLSEYVDDYNVPVVAEETKAIVDENVVTWAQIVEDYFRNEKDAYSYTLISRFGFSPKTLEEIAAELGVTRERVRQIQDAVVFRYLKYIKYSESTRLLEKVKEIFLKHDDNLSLLSFKTVLKKEGVLGQLSEPIKTDHIKNLDLLETLICWLSLLSNKKYTLQPIEFSVDISSLAKSGKISIRDHSILMNISTKERRKVRRKVLFTGGITIKRSI